MYSFSKIKTCFHCDSSTYIEPEFPLGLLFGSELHIKGRAFTALSGEPPFTAFLLLLSLFKESNKTWRWFSICLKAQIIF